MHKPSRIRRHQRSVARKRERRRTRHRRWLKGKHAHDTGLPKLRRIQENRTKTEIWKYHRVEAPKVFSFNENPDGVIKFINEIKELFDARQQTYVVLENVERIDHGAIVTLLAIMIKFKASKIKFNGNVPRDSVSYQTLKESGFFTNLSRSFKEEDSYEIGNMGKNEILTHARKKVDPVLSSLVIKSASSTIWGEPRRCQGVQRVLIELMHNTNNHADINSKGQKHWWLFVNHNERDGVVGFAFVDFGVGIFTSLANKPDNSPLFNWMERIKNRFTIGDRATLLKLIMSGDFHQSVTGEKYRGKGLPGIAQVQERNQISGLKVITNDVYAAPELDEYRILTSAFSGTYVYWELRRENVNCQ